MNQIPKCKVNYRIPQPLRQYQVQNDYSLDKQISSNHNNTKFYVSRNFGKEITNIPNNNVQFTTITSNMRKTVYNDTCTNKQYYKKKQTSNKTIVDINNTNNDNNTNNSKLGRYVSRQNYNNNRLSYNRQTFKRGDNIKKIKLNNSMNYNNNTNKPNVNRPSSNIALRKTNNSMISVRVTNNNNSLGKNNNNHTTVTIQANKTNIISYGNKRQKSINNKNSNKDLIKHVNSINNRENMINSKNKKINKLQIENKENISSNINKIENAIRTEYKTSIIQYESKERTRRNNQSDIKREISLVQKTSKNQVKYFDESKIKNIQIPKDYINTIYYNLLQEENDPKIILLKQNKNFMTEQKEINSKMRSILIDWIIDVHFKFGFTDETLFLTVSIIDRYISVSQISRSNFQLLGITALMIACKHEEIDLPKIDDFIYITDNAYVKKDVLKMEYDILNKLDFSFLYPSPIKFFEYLSIHFDFDKKKHLLGQYLMETFLLDVNNFKYKPSIISCACAYIVLKFFKYKNYYEAYDKKFYNLKDGEYTEGNVKECAKEICLYVDNINKTNYQACIKKYSKVEKENVAILIMNN